jgi:hypothetical protein
VIRTNAVIQKLENFVSQESNLMGDFVKELRSYVEQNVPKKFFKKYSFSSEIKWEEISKEERETSNEDISHMS